jgi:hypothetical protein
MVATARNASSATVVMLTVKMDIAKTAGEKTDDQ